MKTGTREVRVGCSGWSYEHWRGVLYPKTGSSERWLELYAAVFDAVEVNATFYRLPTRRAVARWAAATPPGFRFAVKASRYLTHVTRLRELPNGVARLLDRIEPLRSAGKLGPILWQLPERFHRDDERLAASLGELPPGRNAFELRHESWFDEDVYRLLSEHGVALVAADRAGSRLPAGPLDAAGWTYVRFHHGRGRSGQYTRAQLEAWAERIGALQVDTYAYFNNDWDGYAVENARSLLSLLTRERAGTEAASRLTGRGRAW